MVSSTEEKGTGERASVYGFNVAGKTGTARQTLTVEDPYWDPAVRSAPARRSAYADRWVGAFVGLLPAESPRYAILVLVEQPYMTHYGGAVAAPAFARIAERLTAYANAPADEGRDREVTVRAGSAPGPRAAAVASGRSTSRSDTTVPAGMGPSVVPDFSGMTPARALRTAVESRLTLVAMGSGVAVSQVPAAHAVADSWGEVRVQFVPAELEPEVRE
jgi:cell division protein FtsI (penicillin-binding protein 3)